MKRGAATRKKRQSSRLGKGWHAEKVSYSTLHDLLLHPEDQNFYAVVLSSSAPYFVPPPESKYQCDLLLIDDSVKQPVSFRVVANISEEVPRVTKVGSIIRLQHVGSRKDTEPKCDVCAKGAWILFDPSEGTDPVQFSARNFVLSGADPDLLRVARKFASRYFSDSGSFPYRTLRDSQKLRVFDVLCLVTEPESAGKNRARVRDSTMAAKLELPADIPCLVPGEVALLHAVCWIAGKNSRLRFASDHSAALRVPSEYRYAQALINSLAKDEPTISTRILDAHDCKQVSALKDAFSFPPHTEKRFFRVRVGVEHILPKEPEEWIHASDGQSKCFARFQLFVRDKSTLTDDSMYTINVCTEFTEIGNSEDILRKVPRGIKDRRTILEMMVEAKEVACKLVVLTMVDTEFVCDS